VTHPIDAGIAAELATLPLARLTHFTPARNLSHIIDDGYLRSVADLSEDVRACYRQTDLQRLDGHPDKICCSLQYPNVYYLDIAKRRPDAINYPDWICLLLDRNLLAVEGTLFSARNAAATASDLTPGVAGLQSCYVRSVTGQGGQVRARGSQHDPGSPTDVQAEALVSAPVPLSAVHAIVFPTEAAAAEEYGRLDRIGSLPPATISWMISPGMFNRATIVDAVRYSRYFSETTWSPSATPW
jgi:hypothetical protein